MHEHTHPRIHIHINVCKHTQRDACTYMHIQIHMHIHINTHINIFTHINIYIFTHTLRNTFTHARIFRYTYILEYSDTETFSGTLTYTLPTYIYTDTYSRTQTYKYTPVHISILFSSLSSKILHFSICHDKYKYHHLLRLEPESCRHQVAGEWILKEDRKKLYLQEKANVSSGRLVTSKKINETVVVASHMTY